MPKVTTAKVASSPHVGIHPSDSNESSSSSTSSRSSFLSIKEFKKAKLEEKNNDQLTKPVPQHLISHILPYFYPGDYECEPENDENTGVLPLHLVSHVTPCCYPVDGTVDDENVFSPRPDVVPPHLVSHMSTTCCLLETGEGSIDGGSDSSEDKKPSRTNYVTRHLKSHLFNDCKIKDELNNDTEQDTRRGKCCDMTRDHANSQDTVFAPDDDIIVPLRRFSRRRRFPSHVDLFSESNLKPRPSCITIVQRSPEDTQENLFGSLTAPTRSRRRWDTDSKTAIFGENEAEIDVTSSVSTRKFEDTKEKLFGETYGIKEVEEERLRRLRPLRENTKMNLFGPPTAPTSPRLPARSCSSTHDNLFGSTPPANSHRPRLRRENTFDNLFGDAPSRPVIPASDTERYTPRNPKILQDSLSQVLSSDDPRHGPAPPERRCRKPVNLDDVFRRHKRPTVGTSPITHEQMSANQALDHGLLEAHVVPSLTNCRRRPLSVWDSVNTITGNPLPYSQSEQISVVRDAWMEGTIQGSVAPPRMAVVGETVV